MLAERGQLRNECLSAGSTLERYPRLRKERVAEYRYSKGHHSRFTVKANGAAPRQNGVLLNTKAYTVERLYRTQSRKYSFVCIEKLLLFQIRQK